MRKKNNWIILIALILIVALCWIENSYLTEASTVEETSRKLSHIAFLIVIMLIGYWAWYGHPVKWLKKLWLMAYLFAIAVILLIGAINAGFHVFSTSFLDAIRSFRVFFCSPIPFLALLVFARIANAGRSANSSKS